MENNRNLFLAIALSIVVLLGWQYFVAGPQMEKAKRDQAAQTQTTAQPGPSITPSLPGAPPSTAPAAPAPATGIDAPAATREEAIARSQRLTVDTPRLSASIALMGGRIDDLRLKDYRETTDPQSPNIVILSPPGRPDAYYAELGWISPPGGPAVPTSTTVWTAPADAKLTTSTPVTLTWDNGAGLVFKRTISVDGDFMFTIADSFTNNGAAPVTLYPTGRIARFGEPKTAGYFILHEGPIGVFDKGVSEPNYKDIREAPNREKVEPDAKLGWIGITDKYWAAVLVPEQGRTFSGRFSHSEQPSPFYQADFRSDALTAAPGASSTATSRFFAGAKEVDLLNRYRDQGNIINFDLLISWGWLYFFTKPMFFLLDMFFRLTGNFGIAILLVTVLVKAVFFPLANRSYHSTAAMRKLAPQLAEIRTRYADDKVKQQQAQMELYKKAKINPIAGCWPMAIQIPVFYSLYTVLFITIEMRHAPFFGWIHDLSAPDPTSVFNLFGLLPFDPSTMPMIGHFLALGVWPLVMGLSMWVQMRLNPPPGDPSQAMIFNWMPVIFTFMLAGFPAGLVIYWAWNNTLSVIQQTIIMKRDGAKIDLWDNIVATFRRKPAEPEPPAKPAKPAKPEKAPGKSAKADTAKG